MAYTQTDLDNLDKAIAADNLSVSFGDRSVTYHDINSLLKARAHVASVLAAQQSGSGIRHSLADFGGFDD